MDYHGVFDLERKVIRMRLIDADALADALFEKHRDYPQWVAETIGSMPEAVIRCKDCEYSYTEGFVHERLMCEKHPELCDLKDDWFCADGWKA